jgi:hypothetical protein
MVQKRSFLTAVLAIALLLSFQRQAAAAEGGCMVCVAGGECPVCEQRQVNGGAYCWTNGCSCQTGDWCVIIQGLTQLEDPGRRGLRLRVNPDLIRNIAEVDVYAAVAVAQLGRSAFMWDGYSQLYLPNVKLSPADIEWWFLPGDASEDFLRTKAKRNPSKDLIVYGIDLQRTANPAQRLLVVQRAGAAKQGSSAVAIDLALAENASESQHWAVESWFTVPPEKPNSSQPEVK